MADTLHALQNGSDIRGVALALPGGKPVNLTEQAVEDIAAAFVRWLTRQKGDRAPLRIGVGHDSRLTADALTRAALRGLTGQGATAVDCGLASTPAMYMGTVFPETGFDGAIMLTASHLPKERNGMKFFLPAGGLEKEQITALLDLAETSAPDAPAPGKVEQADLMGLYSAHLRRAIVRGSGRGERPLKGLHIVVDAGNGAGGFFVEEVLEPLGCDCTGSQYLDPDGNFPNHIPNPEDRTAMAAIREAVVAHKAHLGLIFDTDVDRMSAVLPGGVEVNRDAIIALTAAILAPDHPHPRPELKKQQLTRPHRPQELIHPPAPSEKEGDIAQLRGA